MSGYRTLVEQCSTLTGALLWNGRQLATTTDPSNYSSIVTFSKGAGRVFIVQVNIQDILIGWSITQKNDNRLTTDSENIDYET